jgi:ribosomal protein S18 acetylase RimI-like enzyme
MVLKELEKIVGGKGAKRIIIHSRSNAVEFYKKHGYQVVKQSYTLFGVILHFLMEKKI